MGFVMCPTHPTEPLTTCRHCIAATQRSLASSTPHAFTKTEAVEAKAMEAIRQIALANRKLEVAVGALNSIGANTCCDKCQEAAQVARAALATIEEMKG